MTLSMTKPDFSSISLKEFRTYLRKNRHDRQAWEIYLTRMDNEATKISFPCPSGIEDIQQAINSNAELKTKLGI